MALPTKPVRLKRLLEAGFFPLELPNVFETKKFAAEIGRLKKDWPAQQLDNWKSIAEEFSIPKKGHQRRALSLVNPINQYKVSDIVSENWVHIRKHIRSSKLTEFTPIIDMAGERAILPANFREINRRRAKLRANYARILRSDVSRFYPSIYTHSIPWALYGKDWVKQHLHSPAFKGTYGDKLDRALRQGQDNQTIGIPTGPETSRVIAEIVAVGIDKILIDGKSISKLSGLRYVDDYTLGLSSKVSDDTAISQLASSLAHFGLEFHPGKTSIDTTGIDERPEWARTLRQFSFDAGNPENSLRDYFDEIIKLYEEYGEDSLVTYGVKRSRSFILYYGSVNYYVDRLIHLGRICTDALPSIVQAILERNHRYVNFDKSSLGKFINDTIEYRAPLNHTYEVAWALYMARGLRTQFRKSELEPVYTMESSVCALITMELDSKGRITRGADQTYWKRIANSDGLESHMWLLAYEAAQKGWWKGVSSNYVSSHPLFGPMLNRGVYFYNEAKNVSTTFAELRRLRQNRTRMARIFGNLPSYF